MKRYDHIIPNIEDWPINVFHRDRQRIVKKLTKETVDALKRDPELVNYLNQTIYGEKLRTKTSPLKVDPPKEYVYWKKIESELSEAVRDDVDSSKVVVELLTKIVRRYAEEIVGDFKPKTFKFVRKATGLLFRLLLNPFKGRGQGFLWGDRKSLYRRIKLRGPIDDIRALFNKGTVLILPTHFSNLDSLAVGYSIDLLTGLPFFSYGAGLNLYDQELFAYYMSRVGTYKIDRRKRNPIYRKTLSQFSTVGIQEGLNSIFFPGGTRSRDGSIERSLKYGLMNTIIDSQNEFFMRNFDKKIILVPMVVGYHFVLEGRSLIDQHLRKTGKENYLDRLKKKNVSMLRIRFFRRMFTRGSEVTMSFGQPIDIFGNKLDSDGNSIKDGRVIDIKDYFRSNDQLTLDPQRNRVYSRYLANHVVQSYQRENVVLTSHVAAFTAFQMFEKQYPNLDLYSLLALPEDYLDITEEDLCEQITKALLKLRDLRIKGEVKLSEEVQTFDAPEMLKHALKHINSYHFYMPLAIKKGRAKCEDLKLLYFYHNRLYGYKLDRIITVGRQQPIKLRRTLY